MGFFQDWAEHWRWMATEIKELGRTIRDEPKQSAKTFFTHPLTFAFVWFFAALYINGVSSVATERTGGAHNLPLRDQGFSFPKIDSPDLPNYLLYATVGATGLRFLPIWPCTKPAIARTILRRWLYLEGIIFWYRAASVIITSSPNPNPSCVTTATGSVWIESIYISFGKHATCGDCMFSGHTAAITLLMLVWSKYSRGEEFAICFGPCPGILTSNVDASGDPMGWKLLDFLLAGWALMCFYFIIATRFHYSVDVFIGFVITWLLFHVYHFYIKSLAMRRGSLFSRFMRWFEGINLAVENLQAEHDLEQGNVAVNALPTKGEENALRAGAAMTKDNAMLGGDDGVTAVAALPVSYLEGNDYYRAGIDKDSQKSEADREANARRWRSSSTVQGPFEQEATIPRRFASDSEVDAAAPLHNHQLPVPVIVTGEHAAQEYRDVQRETAATSNLLSDQRGLR